MGLTLQHIHASSMARARPPRLFPTARRPVRKDGTTAKAVRCNMRDGYLTVIDSIFMNNQAAPLGPDTGGGAIYVSAARTACSSSEARQQQRRQQRGCCRDALSLS